TRSKRDWSSDVCSSDLEPGGCRVIFGKLLVGQYMLGIGNEAEVFAIGHCCVGILLLWQCRKGHLKPDHILSGHQCRTDIIRRPGVIKYWLARLKTPEHLGHQRLIRPL